MGGIKLYEQMFKYVSILSSLHLTITTAWNYIKCNYRKTPIKQNSNNSHFWALVTDAMEHSPWEFDDCFTLLIIYALWTHYRWRFRLFSVLLIVSAMFWQIIIVYLDSVKHALSLLPSRVSNFYCETFHNSGKITSIIF